MNLNVMIDWKFITALGTAVVGFFCVKKMDSDSVERVLTHVVDAYKESVVAKVGNH
jgi:hypothetical protein